MSDTQNASKEAPRTAAAVENKPAPQEQNPSDRKPGENRDPQK